MSGHTKGPWAVAEDDNDIVAADGTYITYYGGGMNPIERREDAILIAAAPDLLEALEDLVRHQEVLGRHNTIIDKALSAIAKARGEA